MNVENDFIKREIERLNILLSLLIEKISGLNLNNADGAMEEINEVLNNEFDLSLSKIIESDRSKLEEHTKGLHESHLEKLIAILYEIVIKAESLNLDLTYDNKEISKKTILLIDSLDTKSDTFSMERMKIKNVLQRYI